jgi:hypothetical protein
MDFWYIYSYLEVGGFGLSAYLFLSAWNFRYMFEL